MKRILDDIHEHGFALARDHPELLDVHVQQKLAQAAQELGLQFSFDLLTQSATFVRETRTPKYGLKERITILNVWLYLVFRAKNNITIDQEDKWLKLTPEGRREMRDLQEMTITPGRLHSSFPNLYARLQDAQAALGMLERHGLIKGREEEGTRVYSATPRLSHVIEEDQALALVNGHLRGEYKHLMPATIEKATLDAEVLQVIKDLPDLSATSEAIADRLGRSKRVILEALDKLRETGLVFHDPRGARGGTYRISEHEEGEVE